MRFITRIAHAAALCAASLTASFAAPVLPGPTFPAFPDVASVTQQCDSGLATAATRLRALESRAPDGRWVAAADEFNAAVEDVSSPVQFILNVHPDQAVRDAAQACSLRWQDFFSTLGLNQKLYGAARRVKPADAIDRTFLKDYVEAFEDAGVGLPEAQRQRAKQLNDQITELGLQFEKNIRDDKTRVPFTVEELAGVPDHVWTDKPRNEAGQVMLGVDAPTYAAVIERADSAVARERIYRARYAVGGQTNIELLGKMGQLRREYAQLFGFNSYADFKLRRRMALNTVNTQRFLDDVKAAVQQREVRELEELRQAKQQQLATTVAASSPSPAAARIDRWDVAYYTERVRRERYTVDQEAFRPYFPPQESLQFVMKIAERVLGVRYQRVPATLWQPDVQAYLATDVKSGKPLATLFVDLYPRDGKYNHAAVWPLRGGSTRMKRLPMAALVVNMDRKGLTLDELETLLHEMGHALHNNLSSTRYSTQAGTAVLQDFVEAPSQMLEDWVYDKNVLTLFKQVCPTCKPVPDEMIAKATTARDYGKGIRDSRQHLYASYDLALQTADAPEPLATWQRMEGATPLGYVAGTMMPAGFGHLAGGYAAGYYGYLWSLVVAMDLRTAFGSDRLDATVGRRYRDRVLSQGGQKPPAELIRDFLGRETNSKAFFDDLRK